MTSEKTISKQQLEGVVVSDKMMRTVVVEVSRLMKHPQYGKFITRSKRYKAHDAKSAYKAGDRVVIEACRPISKDKRWVVVKKIGSITKVTKVDESTPNA